MAAGEGERHDVGAEEALRVRDIPATQAITETSAAKNSTLRPVAQRARFPADNYRLRLPCVSFQCSLQLRPLVRRDIVDGAMRGPLQHAHDKR